ncbi:AzlC family ABC transporter permease [Pseudobutyrivibrio sp.]|uniref:AzlC family ABC transporter permease n=1 Tax=Pseudobutyrivibrio sp. TaxID=2014367 RepID=UPI001B686749|nr:AzlC family ABC transporter permease [Pseudobutyrivibrio sp.]MBP3262059.1 AzlC family ABC transporter permease [Pseudobutyrivibrio sp.]
MLDNLETKKKAIVQGFKDGFPIGLGYFAVSFSLGIFAKGVGCNVIQGIINSFLNHASAGEYAVYSMIGVGASYLEMAIMTLIVNARYLLMSTALSQRIHPDTPFIHRLGIGFHVTDELFAISINRPGYVNPFYCYGAFIVAVIGWCAGTATGIVAGGILPGRLVSALSVALYGMFLACIMPEARRHRIVAVLIVISFVLSYIANEAAVFASISSGTKTIILTVLIAAVAAIVFPHPEVEDDD